jgi:disulfide bond formation protein DsbB
MNLRSVSPEPLGKPSRLFETRPAAARVGRRGTASDKDGMSASPDRRTAIFLLLVGLAALATAFGAQNYLAMAPCELCLWERWPYRIIILLGVLTLILPPPTRRALLWLGALALVVAIGIAFVHVGVERHWWPSPLPECSASNLVTGNLTALMNSLPARPAKPCDAPNFLLPDVPLSFATMDLLFALFCWAVVTVRLLRPSAR